VLALHRGTPVSLLSILIR